MSAIARQIATNIADKFTMSSKPLIFAGVCALVAERIVQSTMQADEKSKPKVYGSWACKIIQIVATSHAATFGYKFNTLCMAGGFIAANIFDHVGHKKLQNIIYANMYRALLCVAGGYWIDRSVRLTGNTGPIMALTSLALLAISIKNAQFDNTHLKQQIESRTSLKQERLQSSCLLVMIFASGVFAKEIVDSCCK